MSTSNSPNYPVAIPKSMWRGKLYEERRAWASSCFIATDDTRTFLDDVLERAKYIHLSETSFGMLVLGGSGTGKTKLVQFLLSLINAQHGRLDQEKTITPAIKIKVPEVCTSHEFNVAILESMHALNADSKKKAEVLKRTKMALIECEVRVVLVDDFQDIPLRRGERGIDRIGAHIRDLMDASRAVWIFFGTEESNEVRNSKNQLIKRIPYVHRLPYFDIESRGTAVRFSRVLQLLESWLPLSESSCFHQKEYRGLMYLASGGVFDRLVKLLDSSMRVVVRDGRESITREDLEKGFSHLYGSSVSNSNPFRLGFVKRNLNEPNEPFEVLGAQVFEKT